jgi:hypothetical protein
MLRIETAKVFEPLLQPARLERGEARLTWIRLAMELDQARALIEATQEAEEEQPIKAAE